MAIKCGDRNENLIINSLEPNNQTNITTTIKQQKSDDQTFTESKAYLVTKSAKRTTRKFETYASSCQEWNQVHDHISYEYERKSVP